MSLISWIRRKIEGPTPQQKPIQAYFRSSLVNCRPIPQACIDLVKEFEGFYAKAYKCPAGVWTIGYGSIAWFDGTPIKPGMIITKDEAISLMMAELLSKGDVIEDFAAYYKKPLNDNQFSALLSFCFNCGTGILTSPERSLHKAFVGGNSQSVADAFKLYNKGGGRVLKGLVRRRQAEANLYLKPVDSVKLT